MLQALGELGALLCVDLFLGWRRGVAEGARGQILCAAVLGDQVRELREAPVLGREAEGLEGEVLGPFGPLARGDSLEELVGVRAADREAEPKG